MLQSNKPSTLACGGLLILSIYKAIVSNISLYTKV